MDARNAYRCQSSCASGPWRKVTRLAGTFALLSLCMCDYGDNQNPPPLNNLEGYPSRGSITSPPRPASVDIDDPDLRVYLQPIAPAKVDIRAMLKQVDRDVMISLKVLAGPPGKTRVAVDAKSCDKVAVSGPAKLSGEEQVRQAASIGLGELTVNESGVGELVTSIEGATLHGPEGADSLVGRSLVVYQFAGPEKTDVRRELPIACTKI